MRPSCLFPFGKQEEPEKTKPQIHLYTVKLSDAQIKREIDDIDLNWLYPVPLDLKYNYCSCEDWAKAFDWIYFDFKMPNYVSDSRDCDDYAFLLHSLCSMYFRLNSMAIVFGKISMGYHAWNLFRVEDRWLQFESQTGGIVELGEGGYEPQHVII